MSLVMINGQRTIKTLDVEVVTKASYHDRHYDQEYGNKTMNEVSSDFSHRAGKPARNMRKFIDHAKDVLADEETTTIDSELQTTTEPSFEKKYPNGRTNSVTL